MQQKQFLKLTNKLTVHNIIKGVRYLKHYGPKDFFIRLSERFEPEDYPYELWYKNYCASENDLKKQRKHIFKDNILISIVVPAYNTPNIFLQQMIDSVRQQSYSNWELIIGNASPENSNMSVVLDHYIRLDNRIKVINIKSNHGIAQNTNIALAAATGEFIGFMDHDDILAPDALFEFVLKLESDSKIDFIYTDEDKVTTDLNKYFQPHFKPDFNLDLLRSNNYICHFFAVRKTIIEQVGVLCEEYDGAQDYDFILRCTEASRKIAHIPRILYHWRIHNSSTADNPSSKLYAYEAGLHALEAHLKRMNTIGKVTMRSDYGFYDIEYPLTDTPLVSIIIPNRDQSDSLIKCIDSIINKSTYPSYEIIVVENNSCEKKTFNTYKKLEQKGVTIVTYPHKTFNYSAINNYGVKFAHGKYLLLLNNDIEVITPDFIEKMLGNCQRKEVGIVGAKLYYPDNTIQHAGVIIGIGGVAGHAFLGLPRFKSGYFHKASIQMDLSAVTAACLMIKQDLYEEVNGFEESLSVAFNDIDFCLRIREKGYLIVFNPHVEMYHYESKSRGTEDNPEKVKRFNSEIDYMKTHWSHILKSGDPYYNPNLTLSSWNYSLRADGKGVKAWPNR